MEGVIVMNKVDTGVIYVMNVHLQSEFQIQSHILAI